MELRRALLLFAIVLALAAIASAISQPPERQREQTAEEPAAPIARGTGRTAPEAEPQPAGLDEATVRIAAGGPLDRERVAAGRPTTVLVVVRSPGRVEIPSLGLTAPATPLAPARFDLFERERARHKITFVPAVAEIEADTVGVLFVR